MTELTVLQQKLNEKMPKCAIRYNEPMSKHTSFHIGGSVEIMAFPKNPERPRNRHPQPTADPNAAEGTAILCPRQESSIHGE